MAGQLIALLLIGLLATQCLAVLVLRSQAQMLNPVSRDQVLDRLAIVYRMIRMSSVQEERAVLDAMGAGDGARFWIDAQEPPAHPHATREERQVQRDLAAKFTRVPLEDVRVELLAPPGGWLGSFDARLGWSRLPLQTAVRLPDGRWLHGLQEPLAGYQWWRLLRFSIPFSMLPVLLIALVFIYWTVGPIKALAQAAERVSRGERVAPLPLVGPREAREVSAAFNLMQEKLTRFIDDRTQLLAAISHDFRTPITSLRLRVELIADSEQRGKMIRTLDEMRDMVEQTLQFARDDAASEAMQEVDLQALLQEVHDEHRALGRSVRMEAAPSLIHRARVVSLKRAVSNLVDNAVRHGRSARMRLCSGEDIRVEIDDEGPGLPAESLERVFDPFFQLDPSRHRGEGGGVGLGLSIARSCVRAHGGDVTLSNLPAGGLRAVIVLPRLGA